MKGKSEIREFVQGLLAASGDKEPFENNDSLLVSGRLQSIDAVEIVVFLEDAFGIDFAQVGFDREQIDSVDSIDEFIQNAASQSFAAIRPKD
jgi:acyl carrier protein